MIKRTIYYILLLLLLADIGFSFIQHLNTPLDGDMAECIVPADNFKPIFKDPFGIKVVTKKMTYPNPNRYFSHWTFKEYFNIAPLLLQKFTNPIDSIYLACAISKTVIQVCLIILLAFIITGNLNMFKLEFMISAILVTPLFQTNGYRSYMGIIDPSITYTFFYAFPCVLLLLYFLPFIRHSYHKKRLSSQFMIHVLWIPLGLVVTLSGPLNPGIVLIFSIMVLLLKTKSIYSQTNQNGTIIRSLNAVMNIPKYYWFYLIPISIFSIYSLYLGKYNSNNSIYQISLTDLYLRLPEGIYYQFTQKLGFPVLFLILAINAIIIRKRYYTIEGRKTLKVYKWVGIFALIYILLLPLGGYREYRPLVLRYDTIMPITLSLMLLFGATTLFLIRHISNKSKQWYIPIIVGVLFIFTNADEPEFDKNNCEKAAITEISKSTISIVKLDNNCTVLSWDKILNPQDSELNAQLLNIWGVTNEKILYCNK